MIRSSYKTPQSEYRRRFREIELLLRLVEGGLETHRQEHALLPLSWRPVGELAHVRSVLRELWEFLTAIEPCTIEEVVVGMRADGPSSEPTNAGAANDRPPGELAEILDHLVGGLAEQALSEADFDGEQVRWGELWRLACRARELAARGR